MRGWAALGLSPRAAFDVSVSRMSAWRDVQETGRNARPKQAGRAREQAAAIGADSTAVRAKGEKTVVGAVSDAATGEALGTGRTRARFGRIHGVAWRFRTRFRGQGDGSRTTLARTNRLSTSGSRASDSRGAREEAGMKPSRQDRRLGLGRVDTRNLTQRREGAKMRLLRRYSRFLPRHSPESGNPEGWERRLCTPISLNFGLLQPRALMSTRPSLLP